MIRIDFNGFRGGESASDRRADGEPGACDDGDLVGQVDCCGGFQRFLNLELPGLLRRRFHHEVGHELRSFAED